MFYCTYFPFDLGPWLCFPGVWFVLKFFRVLCPFFEGFVVNCLFKISICSKLLTRFKITLWQDQKSFDVFWSLMSPQHVHSCTKRVIICGQLLRLHLKTWPCSTVCVSVAGFQVIWSHVHILDVIWLLCYCFIHRTWTNYFNSSPHWGSRLTVAVIGVISLFLGLGWGYLMYINNNWCHRRRDV